MESTTSYLALTVLVCTQVFLSRNCLARRNLQNHLLWNISFTLGETERCRQIQQIIQGHPAWQIEIQNQKFWFWLVGSMDYWLSQSQVWFLILTNDPELLHFFIHKMGLMIHHMGHSADWSNEVAYSKCPGMEHFAGWNREANVPPSHFNFPLLSPL